MAADSPGLEQVPALRDSLLRRKDWEQIAHQQRNTVFRAASGSLTRARLEAFMQSLDILDDDPLAGLAADNNTQVRSRIADGPTATPDLFLTHQLLNSGRVNCSSKRRHASLSPATHCWAAHHTAGTWLHLVLDHTYEQASHSYAYV